MQLEKYQILEGILQWKGGRIGGAKDTIEISAVTDNPIVKHPITGMPYIPGSSLKGKTRSILELTTEKNRIMSIDEGIKVCKKSIDDHKENEPSTDDKNKHDRWGKELNKLERDLNKWNKRLDAIKNGEPCGCGLGSCLICLAFGPHKNTEHTLGVTRLIFRDAYMATQEDIKKTQGITEPFFTEEDIKKYSLEKGLNYTELKSENIIERHSGRASDPRQMERVIDGSLFKLEIVIKVFENDGREEDGKTLYPVNDILREGLKLLEKDYLGGSGSRGYGKVKFYDLKLDGVAFTL